MNPRGGFTLIEILIFVGIFSLIIVAFMTIFVSTSYIQARQSGALEVTAQSQFLLQTIQNMVERSSLVEVPANTATSTLRLRMASSTEDPTIIQLSGTSVVMRQGTGDSQSLTSSKVNITNLTFTKRENPPGHDSVAVTFTAEYNTTNIRQKFLQKLNLSVARISAASFDSDVVASSSGAYNLGTAPGNWASINGTIYLPGSGKVGIGVSSPSTTLDVFGGNLYLSSAGKGVVLKGPGGSSCYLITITDSGAIATTTVGC